jgi:hypothetical protein
MVFALLYWYAVTLCLGLVIGFALPRRRLLILPVALLLALFWLGIVVSNGGRAYHAALLVGYFGCWSAGVLIGSWFRTRRSRDVNA